MTTPEIHAAAAREAEFFDLLARVPADDREEVLAMLMRIGDAQS